MAKQLRFSNEARKELIEGVNLLANAVTTTLGPRGRNVAIDKKWGAPNVVHDGVSVAKEIELKDPFQNMGAQLLKEAASKTNEVAGDGTTTATVIARELVNSGFNIISSSNQNPMLLKQQIDRGVDRILEKLNTMKKNIQGEDILKVATISAQDERIGSLIAEALEKVGKDGVVTVEEAKGLELTIDHKEGMEFDKGYASAYFVSNAEKMEAEVEDPFILITDKKISNLQELLPFLENIVKTSKNLVIIADEIEGEALATLVVNKLRGTFNVLAVKAPGFGDRRKEMLEDIAILTGGKVISEDTGIKFDSVTIEDCGRADKVWSDKENTRIIGGKGSKTGLTARIAQIKKQMDKTSSDFDKEKLQERLAKLSGGVAVINVGAATEVEMKEKKERVIDAVAATKAAIEEGVVPGGGVALFRAREVLVVNSKVESTSTELSVDQFSERLDHRNLGEQMLYHALGSPIRALLNNATHNDAVTQDILFKLRHPEFIKSNNNSSKEKNKLEVDKLGVNVLTMKYTNMIEEGIIDPFKVTRLALQNATSVATMILTTEALITDIPEEKKETPGGMPPSGMDY